MLMQVMAISLGHDKLRKKIAFESALQAKCHVTDRERKSALLALSISTKVTKLRSENSDTTFF